MKDSIFHVPIAEDFIDLEQLFRISRPSFSSFEHVFVNLKYLFHKEEIVVGVRARDLFDSEEMKQYDGYQIGNPMNFSGGNELGEKFKEGAIKKFEEKVRLPIYNAWKEYRESKNK